MIILIPHKQLNKGAALLEFAIIFPIFIAVLFTIIQYSLVLVNKASIDYVSEELLAEIATADYDPSYQEDLYWVDLWKQGLKDFQVTSDNPQMRILSFYGATDFDEIPLELRNINDQDNALREDSFIKMIKLQVNVPINCVMSGLTFGLSDELCRHRKDYLRIVNIE